MAPPSFQSEFPPEPIRRVVRALFLCLLACTGCTQPLRVDTRTSVDAVGNINVDATGNVKAQLAPTPRLEPVTAMGLPNRPQDPNAPKIAIIDVDGLLL